MGSRQLTFAQCIGKPALRSASRSLGSWISLIGAKFRAGKQAVAGAYCADANKIPHPASGGASSGRNSFGIPERTSRAREIDGMWLLGRDERRNVVSMTDKVASNA
jgi:hypothetical protein